MYLTGDQFNYTARLHELPTGVSDLDLFKIEGSQYTGSWHNTNYWNKEFVKKYEIFDSPSGTFSL